MSDISFIPGFPGYGATTDGNVWTCWKQKAGKVYDNDGNLIHKGIAGWYRSSNWKVMKLLLSRRWNRNQVDLRCENGIRTTHLVAPLILLTFKGPKPEFVCRHINDISFDDRAENLQWGTQKDNIEDCKRNGNFRKARGENNGASKLSDLQVKSMRILYETFNIKQKKLCEIFKVSPSTVSEILAYKIRI